MLGLTKLGIDDPSGKDPQAARHLRLKSTAAPPMRLPWSQDAAWASVRLKFRDWGKVAATFVDVSSGKAVRIAAKESSKNLARQMHPEIADKNQQQMLAYREITDDDFHDAMG